MNPIIIKDSANTNTEFTVVRQPGGNATAILHAVKTGSGMNRTAFPKIEISASQKAGSSDPVLTVTVPYGAVVDGNFKKLGQVVRTFIGRLPADSPEQARLDAEAFARNVLANAQIMALFQNGTVS